MKYFYGIILLITAITCNLFSYERHIVSNQFIIDPQNDKEMIVIARYGSQSQAYMYTVDLATGNVQAFATEISVNGFDEIISAADGNTKKVAVIQEDKLDVFNYANGTKILTKALSGELSGDCRYGFSSEGNYLCVFKKDILKLNKIDIATGNVVDHFVLNANPYYYSESYLVPGTDEFALRSGDSLELWSATEKKLIRKVGVPAGATMIKFGDGGKKLSYIVGPDSLVLVNVSDGSPVFSKKLEVSVADYSFTLNMRYLLYNHYIFSQTVYDIVSDKPVIENTKEYRFPVNKFAHLTSDLKRGFGYETDEFYCERYNDEPIGQSIYYLYNLEDSARLVSVSPGYVSYPETITLNSDASLAVVWGTGSCDNDYVPNPSNALIDVSTSRFSKYLASSLKPRMFTPDSKYLLFTDSCNVLFLNVETNKIEKTLNTGLGKITFLAFNNTASHFLYVTDGNWMASYEYDNNLKPISTLNVESFYEVTVSYMPPSPQSNIIFFSTNRSYCKLNPVTGVITKKMMPDKLIDMTIADYTNDGKYILVTDINNKKVYVLECETNNIIIEYTLKDFYYYSSEYVSAGFLGSYKIIWLYYMQDPILKRMEFYGLNLETGTKADLWGEKRPYLLPDGERYFSTYCPTSYNINVLPGDLKTGVEEETATVTAGSITYPNPTSGITILKVNASKVYDSFLIFDIYGRLVDQAYYSINSAGEGIVIDAGRLNPGSYIVKFISGSNAEYTRFQVTR